MIRNDHRVLLQGIQCNLHSLLQLGIMSCRYRCGIIFDFNIRCDTAILNFPIAMQSLQRPTRRSNKASIDKRWIVPNAH